MKRQKSSETVMRRVEAFPHRSSETNSSVFTQPVLPQRLNRASENTFVWEGIREDLAFPFHKRDTRTK